MDALNSFLSKAPKDPLAPQVQDLRAKVEKAPAATPVRAAPIVVAEDTKITNTRWQPLGIDEVHPAVAAGVACPLGEVLSLTGRHMEEFVADISKFAAIEDLTHERLDKSGFPLSKESRKFDYIASTCSTFTAKAVGTS